MHLMDTFFPGSHIYGRPDGLLAGILDFMATPIAMFLNKEHGSHALTLPKIIGGVVVMRIYLSLAQWMGIGPGAFSLFSWFMMSYLALALLHKVRIWQRERAADLDPSRPSVHRESRGEGWITYLPWWPQLGIHDNWRYRLVEPACALLVGLLLRPFDPITGTWLCISAIALGIRNHMMLQRIFERRRIMRDTRREAMDLHRQTSVNPDPQRQPGSVVRPYQPSGGAGRVIADHEDTIQEVVQEVMGGAVQGAALGLAAEAVEDWWFGDEDAV